MEKIKTLDDMKVFADKLTYLIPSLPKNIKINVSLNHAEYIELQNEIRKETQFMSPKMYETNNSSELIKGYIFTSVQFLGTKFIIEIKEEVKNVVD